MAQSLKVYISSTSELKEERKAVFSAIQRAQHQPIGMEHYGAGEEAPLTKCVEDVEACDMYVGIIGWRYGYQPPGANGKSITEAEYDAAGRSNIPRLMYLSPESEEWDREPKDKNSQRIAEFRERIRINRTVRFFRSSQDLDQVGTDILLTAQKFGLGRAPYVPPLLPYLCNRHTQCRSLGDNILQWRQAGRKHPLVCVVHGNDNQAVGQFIDCIRERYLAEMLNLSAKSLAAREVYVRWPNWKGQELEHEYTRQLCEKIVNLGATIDDMKAELVRASEPMLATTAIPVEQWCLDNGEHFLNLLHSLATLQIGPVNYPLVIVFTVQYSTRTKSFLLRFARTRRDRQFKRLINDIDQVLHSQIDASNPVGHPTLQIPELKNVIQVDVEEWSRLDEVQRISRRDSLYEDTRDLFQSRSSYPMEDLAPLLREMLE